MKNSRTNRRKNLKKGMRLNGFRAAKKFDEENGNSVTDDTLEFLCLDDEVIESYKNRHKSTPSALEASSPRYEEDDAYEDEEYEDDEYEDEEYEDDAYEDEDDEDDEDEYEDEEYEDDEYEDVGYEDEEYEYVDKRGGVVVRFRRFLAEMSTLDIVVAVLGVVVLMGALMSGVLYANAKSIEKQVESFETVGEEMAGISVIGEGGLLAVSESARLASMIGVEEEPEEVEEEPEPVPGKTIEVTLNVTSIQSDIKIKFVNKETGKLIGGVPFEVEASGEKKTLELKDKDKDGIIYETGIEAGTYKVTVKPFKDSGYEEYKLPVSATSVKVTDTIAYKKVDVTDEVKSESEINAAKEDTAVQDMVVESALTDTVEWVESTKTPVGGEQAVYEEVPKQNIPDPWLVGGAYRKLVSEGDITASLAPNNLNLNKEDSAKLEVKVSVEGSTQHSVEVIDWYSDNPSAATVSEGTVTAVGSGNAKITAKVNVTVTEENQTVEIITLPCTVVVNEDENETQQPGTGEGGGNSNPSNPGTAYTSVTISGAQEVYVGKMITLVAKTVPENGAVIWSSDNEGVAKVDGAGVVTGVAEGTANIKAVCRDSESVFATYAVKVKKEVTIDGTAKLKDKNGNQMYYKDASGAYREATYNDYKTYDKFYKKSSVVTEYRYTGWQTIDGSVYFFDKNGNFVTGEQVIQGAKYTFGSDGKLASGSGSMGIDVSKWNGNIDWNAVKNSGVSYVIIRCGYRGSSTGVLVEDPMFKSNIKGAKAAGLKVGVYFFSQAVNEVEAVEEASMAISLVSGYGLNYPIFLDVESSGGRGDGVSKDMRTAVCKAFCATVQNSGYTAGIYANKNWLTSYINTASLTNYKIWLAQYASAPSYTATKYDIWQYSSKGRVSGISGDVDMNISYMGY